MNNENVEEIVATRTGEKYDRRKLIGLCRKISMAGKRKFSLANLVSRSLYLRSMKKLSIQEFLARLSALFRLRRNVRWTLRFYFYLPRFLFFFFFFFFILGIELETRCGRLPTGRRRKLENIYGVE